MNGQANGLRQRAARGTLVNGAYQVTITTLSLLRGVVVAAFLSASEYGVWGILIVSLLTVAWLKQVGVQDKYVQQTEDDQERAFQKAFTLELALTVIVALLFAALTPLLAIVYGEGELVAPGLVMAATFVLYGLQTPALIFYRRMEFARQRLLQAIDPVLSFVVTVVLAAAGAGYWSLVIGAVVGGLAGAAAALLASPYRLALVYDRATAREYVSFSWPLLVASASSLVIAQAAIIAGEATLGLAGAGMITLAATIAQYAERVDAVVTTTLYPAICRVRDRTDLLVETFVKSNRLALMWGMPFGIGLTLFASDLVHHVLGAEWEPVVVLLQVYGVAVAAYQVGFNWDAFYRARGDTRPVAVWSALTTATFLAVALPLLIADGLSGFAIGMGVMTAVSFAVRAFYLGRMFSGLRVATHTLRAVAPSVPAVAAVLAVRAADSSSRTGGVAIAELALYAAVTLGATLWLERALLREVAGYLRGAPRPRPTAAV